MASTFNWTLRYGATGTKVVGKAHTPTGSETREEGMAANSGLLNINFLSIDTGEAVGGLKANGAVDYTIYPIRAGENSVERWVRPHWHFDAGVTNKISGVKFWMSAGNNVLNDPIAIYYKVTQTYSTPSTGTAVIGANSAGNIVPTGTPTFCSNPVSVTFAGQATLTSGALAGGGQYSDYVVLQLRTSNSATPGNVQQKTFTIQYDEN